MPFALGRAVDQVTGDGDEVGLLGVDEVDDLPREVGAAHGAGVDVGDERDPGAVELRGQVGEEASTRVTSSRAASHAPYPTSATVTATTSGEATRFRARRAPRPCSRRQSTNHSRMLRSQTGTSPRKR